MNINCKDFEELAKRNLEKATFDFFSGGASNEITLKENETAFDTIKLIPRVLRGITEPETTVTIMNQTISFPLLIAPMAFQNLAHPKGEKSTAIAAKLANILMTSSIYSTTSLKEIISESILKSWFQLYILKDRHLTREIIQHAEDSGCAALVLTVDAPLYGKREKELKNPLKHNIVLPDILALTKQLGIDAKFSQAKNLSSFLEPAISWNDIEWISTITKMPIVLKGILSANDAKIALENDVKGIIVSNHGGRQLDTAIATIYALPKIVETVDEKIDVFMDGGIRKGTDILKALALGAKAVFIGRPILWALAANGETGVYNLLSMLQQELKLAMTLCGCKKIQEINSELIFKNFK